MKHPPPPDPPDPELELPVESPNPAAVCVNTIPVLNMAFHAPPTLTYPSVISFHTPDIFAKMLDTVFHSPLILTLAFTPTLNANTANPFPPTPPEALPATATPES